MVYSLWLIAHSKMMRQNNSYIRPPAGEAGNDS